VIQLSYAIGVSQPLSIYLDIFQEDQKLVDQITKVIQDNFDLSPRGIRNKLELNKPIYKKTAAYGHFGRAPEADGSFSWEKTDMVNVFKKEV
jgi:S-adenosylmethionine synthetase